MNTTTDTTRPIDRFRAGETFGVFTYTVAEEYTYRYAGYETASAWTEYRILPGTYPVKLVNSGGSEWNPSPDVATPGFIANVGPDRYVVAVDAIKIRDYYENRLGAEIRPQLWEGEEPTTVVFSGYGYQVTDSAPFTRTDEGA